MLQKIRIPPWRDQHPILRPVRDNVDDTTDPSAGIAALVRCGQTMMGESSWPATYAYAYLHHKEDLTD